MGFTDWMLVRASLQNVVGLAGWIGVQMWDLWVDFSHKDEDQNKEDDIKRTTKEIETLRGYDRVYMEN